MHQVPNQALRELDLSERYRQVKMLFRIAVLRYFDDDLTPLKTDREFALTASSIALSAFYFPRHQESNGFVDHPKPEADAPSASEIYRQTVNPRPHLQEECPAAKSNREPLKWVSL